MTKWAAVKAESTTLNFSFLNNDPIFHKKPEKKKKMQVCVEMKQSKITENLMSSSTQYGLQNTQTEMSHIK